MNALLAADLPYWAQTLLRILGGLVAVLLPAEPSCICSCSR
jgi:hypothetical protein